MTKIDLFLSEFYYVNTVLKLKLKAVLSTALAKYQLFEKQA